MVHNRSLFLRSIAAYQLGVQLLHDGMKVLRHVDTVPRQVSYRNDSLRVPHGWLLIYSGSSLEPDNCVTRRNLAEQVDSHCADTAAYCTRFMSLREDINGQTGGCKITQFRMLLWPIKYLYIITYKMAEERDSNFRFNLPINKLLILHCARYAESGRNAGGEHILGTKVWGEPLG